MSDIVTKRNIGALIVVSTCIEPQDVSAGVTSGGSIDRGAHSMPESCVLHQDVGAVSGAPSAIAIYGALQHSPDNSTWSAYTDPDTGSAVVTPTITTSNTGASVNVDLTNAYRYIRPVTSAAFTGGTSPEAYVDGVVVIGGGSENPLV